MGLVIVHVTREKTEIDPGNSAPPTHLAPAPLARCFLNGAVTLLPLGGGLDTICAQ